METGAWLVLPEVRSLLTSHLGGPLLKSFQDLTGYQLHVIWHDPLEFHDPDHLPVLCPAARALLRAGNDLTEGCADCQRDSWRPMDTAPGEGRRLRGACGAICFWAGLQAGSWRPVTLALRRNTPSSGFDQAVQVLLKVLHETQTALAADLAHRELEHVLRQQHFPDAARVTTPIASPHAGGTHTHGAVPMMLDYLHAHYQQPLGLADVAAALKMNASYLSTRFSAAMGVGFHEYLSEFRLAKARELLLDPARHICAVAAATGHSSPSHFDNVFKASVGISPSAWRDANRPRVPAHPPAIVISGPKTNGS
jgi:AraC-like DNA-binding protein